MDEIVSFGLCGDGADRPYAVDECAAARCWAVLNALFVTEWRIDEETNRKKEILSLFNKPQVRKYVQSGPFMD